MTPSPANRLQIADALAEALRYTKEEYEAELGVMTSLELAGLANRNYQRAVKLIESAIGRSLLEGPRFRLEHFQDAVMAEYRVGFPDKAWCLRVLRSVGSVQGSTDGAFTWVEPRRTYGIINKIWGA